MSEKGSVLVLGAGVIGTATAYFLTRQGFSVTVIEREDGAGQITSFANGGLITPSMADPWAAPGMAWKLLSWIGREDSPFLLRPQHIPELMSWGTRFLLNCRISVWQRNTAIILRLAEYSQNMLQELTGETGLAYDLAERGTLRLFRDELSMENARRGAELLGRFGVDHRVLDAAGCLAVEPSLAPKAAEISGGIHYPGDMSGDAFQFTRNLAALCARRGAVFQYGTTVESIETGAGRVSAVVTDKGRFTADHYVLAVGNGLPGFKRALALPIYPVKGYSVTFSTAGWNGAPKVPMIDDARKIGIVPIGDRLRVAGTIEFTGDDPSLNARRGAKLVENLSALYPDLPARSTGQHWAGLRPTTPDGIPVLGRTKLRNLSVNLGHGHLGWTMAAGCGNALADQIAGATPALDLAPYGVERFRRFL
jgi:D-amino-acid dehydrogenase